jgi:hypothetical protein
MFAFGHRGYVPSSGAHAEASAAQSAIAEAPKRAEILFISLASRESLDVRHERFHRFRLLDDKHRLHLVAGTLDQRESFEVTSRHSFVVDVINGLGKNAEIVLALFAALEEHDGIFARNEFGIAENSLRFTI